MLLWRAVTHAAKHLHSFLRRRFAHELQGQLVVKRFHLGKLLRRLAHRVDLQPQFGRFELQPQVGAASVDFSAAARAVSEVFRGGG